VALFETASMGTLAVSCSTSSAPEPHCLLACGGSVGLVTCAEQNDRLDPSKSPEIDCEEDRTLRAVLVGMLRETDR